MSADNNFDMQLIAIYNLEVLMNETKFKLHDDPEEVQRLENLIDP